MARDARSDAADFYPGGNTPRRPSSDSDFERHMADDTIHTTAAEKANPYILNPDTGLSHRIRIETNELGEAQIAVDQEGVER